MQSIYKYIVSLHSEGIPCIRITGSEVSDDIYVHWGETESFWYSSPLTLVMNTKNAFVEYYTLPERDRPVLQDLGIQDNGEEYQVVLIQWEF